MSKIKPTATGAPQRIASGTNRPVSGPDADEDLDPKLQSLRRDHSADYETLMRGGNPPIN